MEGVISQILFMKRLRDRDRDDVTNWVGTDLARFERFPLTFEGAFMMIPPLVGLDLDAILWHLPYLI